MYRTTAERDARPSPGPRGTTRAARARRLGQPLLACLVALLGCASRERAGAIVEVTSDSAVPAELDRLLFRVTGAGPDQEKVHDLAAGTGAHTLPARFGVEGESGQRVRVEVVGRQGGDDVISRRVSVTLFPAPPVVRVALPRACARTRCPGPEACATNPECRPEEAPDAATGDADSAATGPVDGSSSLDAATESPRPDAVAARAWTQIASDPSLPSPDPRGEPVMVLDPSRRKLILFGGKSAFDAGVGLDDLWELDLETLRWAKRGPVEASAPWPRSAARDEAWWPPVATYDEARGRVVFYGAGARVNDDADVPVWEWDGAAGVWSPRAGIPRPRSTTTQTALLHLAAARDLGRAADVVLISFYVDASPFDATYEARLGETALVPKTGATPSLSVHGSGLFYDPAAARVRLLAYATVSNRPALRLWTWSPAPPGWHEEAKPIALPRAFDGGNHLLSVSRAFDASSGRVFFYSFPGQAPEFEYEVLLWSAELQTGAIERWSSSGPQPLVRQWPGLVADPATGTLLMFGGYRDRPVGDLWRWDPRGGVAAILGD